MSDVRPLAFVREDGEKTAIGVQFPSGHVAVEWRREAFPEGERCADPVTSLYGNLADAEQAAGDGSTVEFEEE